MIRSETIKDYGTVYYALSLTIITIYSWKIQKPEIGLCPFLCMAYGDGFACIFGSNIKSPYKIIFGSKKSIIGCLTMFLVCFILYLIFFWFYQINFGFIKSIFMGLLSMILEGITPYGMDNLTVPIVNLIIINFLL